MEPAPIVEAFDVAEDFPSALSSSSKTLPVNALAFERTEKGFHRRIVIATTLATHAANNPVVFEQLPVRSAGILNARSE
jgi:hypothetical protein